MVVSEIFSGKNLRAKVKEKTQNYSKRHNLKCWLWSFSWIMLSSYTCHLCETNMEELLDSDNISVNNYCPLIWKNSNSYASNFLWKRVFFGTWYFSGKLRWLLCIVLPGSTSFSVLFLLPLLITTVYPIYHFWFSFIKYWQNSFNLSLNQDICFC